MKGRYTLIGIIILWWIYDKERQSPDGWQRLWGVIGSGNCCIIKVASLIIAKEKCFWWLAYKWSFQYSRTIHLDFIPLKKMWRTFLTVSAILFNSYYCVNCLSCDSLLHSPEQDGNGTINGQLLFVAELEASDYKDLLSCLATIGQEQIPQEQANNVWNALKKVKIFILKYQLYYH